MRPRKQWQWRQQPTAATVGAGKGCGSREAAQGQTTINPKAIAIADLTLAVETAWRQQRGSHGSGDGGASMGPTMTEEAANVGWRSSFVLLFA